MQPRTSRASTGPDRGPDAAPQQPFRKRVGEMGAKPRRPLRQRLGIRPLLAGLLILGLVAASAAIGYYGLAVIAESKRSDIWAIAYLNLEQRADAVGRDLQALFKDSPP